MGAAGAEAGKAPFKVLFSNDTTNILTCVSPYHQKGEAFTADMIRATVDEVAGVDVHMLQPGLGWVPWWKSEILPIEEHHAWFKEQFGIEPKNSVHDFLLAGGDVVGVFVERCREKGQAPFISYRLNDGHHLELIKEPKPFVVQSLCKFYVDHPEYRVGTDVRNWDQHVQNWAIPEVREYKFRFIEEICENYDIDGFELDFMRHVSLFPQDTTTVEERRAVIEGFVGRVRKLLDRTAKPGQHRWLCARIPAYFEAHDRQGIDVARMVAAGLDMVNLSCYYFTEQQTDLAEIRKLAPNAALYLEMTHCASVGPPIAKGYDNFTFLRTTAEQFYTAANLAYRGGADGMSLFNFVYYREHGTPGRGPFNEPPFEVLERLGEPEWLARQPQWYMLGKAWNQPPVSDRRLPRKFQAGNTHTFPMDMALPKLEGGVKEVMVRVMTQADCSACTWEASMNGMALEPSAFVAKPLDHPYDGGLGEANQYACFSCKPGALHDGANALTVTLKEGPEVEVIFVDVVVK